MGVTITSKNHSITIPYNSLRILRGKIAALCPKEIAEHYNILMTGQPEDFDWEKYDLKTELLYYKYPAQRKTINFLYAPDTDARFGYGTAKKLLQLIQDPSGKSKIPEYTIGYPGQKHPENFSDFLKILEDSVRTKKDFYWY